MFLVSVRCGRFIVLFLLVEIGFVWDFTILTKKSLSTYANKILDTKRNISNSGKY